MGPAGDATDAANFGLCRDCGLLKGVGKKERIRMPWLVQENCDLRFCCKHPNRLSLREIQARRVLVSAAIAGTLAQIIPNTFFTASRELQSAFAAGPCKTDCTCAPVLTPQGHLHLQPHGACGRRRSACETRPDVSCCGHLCRERRQQQGGGRTRPGMVANGVRPDMRWARRALPGACRRKARTVALLHARQ